MTNIRSSGQHLDQQIYLLRRHFTRKMDCRGTPWTGKLKLPRPGKTAVLGTFSSIWGAPDHNSREGGKKRDGTASRKMGILSLKRYTKSKKHLIQKGDWQIQISEILARSDGSGSYWGPVLLQFSALASIKFAEGWLVLRGEGSD